MTKKKNQTQIHFRMDTKDVKELDRTAKRNGYSSRSELLTALALAASRGTKLAEQIYGKPIPESAKTLIDTHTLQISEEKLQKTLTDTIEEMLFPVIALRGADIAGDTAWKDIRSAVREKTGVWLTESEIKEAIEHFEHLNRPRLTDHRNTVLEGGDA